MISAQAQGWLETVAADRRLVGWLPFRLAFAIATRSIVPSTETLAAEIGTSRVLVARSLRELVDRGHLQKRRSSAGRMTIVRPSRPSVEARR